MATIKTTGTGATLRILTKTVSGVQRVSCSCCEEGCCMYPADHDWGDGSDLPDAVTLVLPQDSPLILNAIRNGDEFSVADPVYWSPVTFAPDPETLYSPRQYFRIKKGMDDLGPDVWLVQFRYEDQNWVSSNGGLYRSSCLFTGDGNLTPGDDYYVEDQFAASYLVELTDSIGPSSFLVERVDLCTWIWSESLGEFTSDVTLYFDSVNFLWVVTGGYFPDGTEGSQSLFIGANRSELATPLGAYLNDGSGYSALTVSPAP